ncbi:MAG TPA: aminotransferase class I/II-fold pyridoxal phosphate-dependent enzyme [Mycobacteriales bacterium]|nr:aminotransferase class I/II-fold pyridoxal phosphate-dependent enzyme [Mycobacteriales bacterium]
MSDEFPTSNERPSNLPIIEPGATTARSENTRAVHAPRPDFSSVRTLGLPTYRTSAFEFERTQDYAAVLNDRKPGYSYSRIDNPTADAFALGVAALEAHGLDRAVGAQPFASGMAAISTVFLALARAGGHVVAPAAVYGGTYGLIQHVLGRFGVEATMVDMTDLDAVRAAVRESTSLVWAETIANPTTAVTDLPAVAAICHEAGVPFCVDSTFAPPPVCRPLAWGADLVVHSATKYLGGHSDVTGGVVVGDIGLVTQVRAARIDLGGSLAPDEAFLLHRGLATLPLRVERHCATALAVAEALVGHPAVERIEYPGLTGHPQHALAGKLFETGPGGPRYGAILTISPRGGRAAGYELADGLRVGTVATSLGGVHTVVSHVASTTHRQFDDAALEAAGIAPAAVRFSIGLEDADDLVDDIERALDAVLRAQR